MNGYLMCPCQAMDSPAMTWNYYIGSRKYQNCWLIVWNIFFFFRMFTQNKFHFFFAPFGIEMTREKKTDQQNCCKIVFMSILQTLRTNHMDGLRSKKKKTGTMAYISMRHMVVHFKPKSNNFQLNIFFLVGSFAKHKPLVEHDCKSSINKYNVHESRRAHVVDVTPNQFAKCACMSLNATSVDYLFIT